MPTAGNAKRGSLVALGTGIRIVGQLTIEAIAAMKTADKLLYVVADPVAEETLHQLNAQGAESLAGLYVEGKPRVETYQDMVERTLTCVRSGLTTCLALYGHPGVFAYPGHEAVRRARAEGYAARMLPGISAEDCLFADLGIDPANCGCQSYEATDLLLNGRLIDPRAALVLWQIGGVGDLAYRRNGYNLSALPVLIERLCQFYRPDHTCIVYEAAVVPGAEPVIRPLALRDLVTAPLSSTSTLYVPPV